MSTKILIENNKIVFEGHAEDSETCRTLTAICDALAMNKDFETVKYENGYAEFNRVNGGESEMFAALEAQVAALKQQVAAIKSCECDMSLYLSKNEASLTYETKNAHEASIALLQNAIDKINTTLGYVDTSKGSVADQLNYLNLTIIEVQNMAEKAIKLAEEENSKISALEARLTALENKTTKTLPFTADQLIAKLESI